MGKSIEQAHSNVVKDIFSRYSIKKYKNYTAVIVNGTSHWDEVGEYLLEHHDVDFTLCWHIDHQYDLFLGSLRSKKIDVSKLALSIGGGGHPKRAGFDLSVEEGLALLKKIK